MVREPRFHLTMPVQWEDTDMAGVVFYPNFFKFFERAEDELFLSRGRPRPEFLSRRGVWLPRVEAHAEYVNPARYGDTLDIVGLIARVGRTSVRYEFEVFRIDPAPKMTLARGHVVTVCVSATTFQPTPLPEEMREALES